MTGIVLTKNGGILSPIYYILGMLMNGIFTVLDKFGIPNVGLAIILFTLIIYLCLLPLTIKQQKFSKLSSRMNPELQAITNKYKDKRGDNEAMMKMNEETKAVYEKYGVSQTGSCLNIFIQLPIMWCLYRIIYNMPAYVPSIKSVFTNLVTSLSNIEGSAEFLQTFKNASYYSKQFKNEQFVAGSEYMKNTFIDVLNKASSTEWMSLKEKFGELSAEITTVYDKLSEYNYFFGINIANSPGDTIKQGFESGSMLLVIGAAMIPILAALTQWINTKLMPQPEQDKNAEPNPMMASMKMMNYTMPIFSAIMCFSLPAGLGLYWISGAVIRGVQQVAINKHIDKIDIDEMIKKNMEKAEKKAIAYNKDAVAPSTISGKAHKNTKNIAFENKGYVAPTVDVKAEEKSKKKKNEQPVGSIAAKANKVKQFNEKN